MQSAIISLVVSVLALWGLVFLFRIEKNRQKRFLEEKRAVFDHTVTQTFLFIEHVTKPLRRDTLRHSLHYFFHRALHVLKQGLRALDARLDALLRTNRALARKVHRDSQETSKLQAIADHKLSTALSPEEQKSRKEKAIGTQL